MPAECAQGSDCEVPAGATWILDKSVDVATLTIRGTLKWDVASAGLQLRACHIMVEDGGLFEVGTRDRPMDLNATIYIKKCGSVTGPAGKRFLGSRGASRIEINGRPLERTMTLLSEHAAQGSTELALKHDPESMGWRVGDRIGIATTKARLSDSSEHRIQEVLPFGLRISPGLPASRLGGFKDVEGQQFEVAAEVVNMERSVLITGDHDDFVSSGQGLHVMIMGAGSIGVVRHARVEYCGQNGVTGRYCLHFHLSGQCPQCVFQGNAVVESFQSAITIHGSHRTLVDSNVLWMNRGVGIYVEDGNEMNNTISHNTVICPYWNPAKRSAGVEGPYCQVKGANAAEAGVGIYMVGMTNDVIGNHIVGHRHGLFTPGNLHHIGQGAAHGKVCPKHLPYGVMRGNVNHDNSHFGLYPDNQFPRDVGPRDENGYVVDMERCWMELTPEGKDNGIVPASVIEDCLDYHNDFVGQYTAGDIMYLRFKAVDCDSGMYWKRSKNFADPNAVHIRDSVFADTSARIPGGAFTFTMEGVILAGRAQLQSPQHCFGAPLGESSLQGMTCNVQNLLKGVDTTTHMYSWVRNSGSQVIHFGVSDGDPVRILWVSPDDSLGGYGAIVSPYLNGFALVPGCEGPLSKWGGGYGCGKATPVRRLNIYGPDFGRITISGPGYEGVTREDSKPTFGMNAGSLWWNPPFHDPSGNWRNQGSYAAPVVAGASYTVEGLRWLEDEGQTGDIIVEFSDAQASQLLGDAHESVTLTLITDRGQVTCTASADADRRFFASGQSGPETGAALGDCGEKFRSLAGKAPAAKLDRAHRRRRAHATPVPTAAPTPAQTPAPSSSSGSCDDDCSYEGKSMYRGVDSCRNRLEWVLSTRQPVHVAYRIVNEGCSGQCFCDASGGSTTTPAPTPVPPAKECWGELLALAADEGDHLETVRTDSEAECKRSCEATAGCQSASMCPQWNGCWLKGRSFAGSEATVPKGAPFCKTLYRKVCGDGSEPTPAPTAALPPAAAVTLAPTPAPTSPPLAPTPAPTPQGPAECWGQLAGLATDEGQEIGHVATSSATDCRAACDATSGCRSVSLCPQWRGCWLKGRSYTGSEASATKGACQTHYKVLGAACKSVPTPAPSPSTSSSCHADCTYTGNMMYGGVDSCRNRLNWILSTGQPESVAYRIVNDGCSGQCRCSSPM